MILQYRKKYQLLVLKKKYNTMKTYIGNLSTPYVK